MWKSRPMNTRALALSLLAIVILVKTCHGVLSEAEADRMALNAIGEAAGKVMFVGDNLNDAGISIGRLKQYHYECNSVIATLSPKGLGDFIVQVLADYGVTEAWQRFGIKVGVMARMTYGLQVWKVCGRCSDFEEQPRVVGCRSEDYGYNALSSGVLIAPYDFDKGKIMEGTRPMTIIGTAGGLVPSQGWGETISDPQLLIGSYMTSATRSYTLLPDQLGFGESLDYFRPFLMYQPVLTAFMPLLWQAEAIIARETNCSSAVADEFATWGYSEGGYRAVAMGDALDRMGKKIVAVHTGGGAYRVSSTVCDAFFQKMKAGGYHETFFVALLAAGLSSTITDAPNYNAGQDMLAREVRNGLVEAAQTENRNDRRPIYAIVPMENPYAIINPDLRSIFEEGNAENSSEPCVTHVNNKTDLLCQALIDQDLVQITETASYDIYICHSQNDQLIPYSNLPDLRTNGNLHLKTVEGGHQKAMVPCVIETILHYNNPLNFWLGDYGEKTHDGSCDGPQTGLPSAEGCWSLLFDFFGICFSGFSFGL